MGLNLTKEYNLKLFAKGKTNVVESLRVPGGLVP